MMEIEFWPIDRPTPYAKNPRKIPQSAIDKVAASIKEFGWRQPIVVASDGVIVVGHSRLLAARKLGLLEVPVHVAADLTEAQCRAYRIADNRVGEEARWDDELLKLELSELGALADLTAFDPKELTRLGLGEAAPQDAIPAPPASPVARSGQLWQLGKHRILCGDSTRPECVSRLMGLAATAGVRSIWPFTKSRSNVRSRQTQPGTAGTHRRGKRCSRLSGTKSGLSITSRSSGSKVDPS